MKVAFLQSFERDLKKLRKDRLLLARIRRAIEEVEAARGLRDLEGMRKLGGGRGTFYRLRVGEYRIGLELDNETAVFVRCLHRRDIYRYFP